MFATIRSLAAVSALALAALAAAPAAAQTTPPAPAPQDSVRAAQPQQASSRPPRRDRNFITREEIEARPTTDALQLVQTLRPAWLRGARGDSGTTRPEVVVYQDGIRLGTRESLARVPLAIIRGIRYYDATAASARFGADHMAGAIVVVTQEASEHMKQ